VCKRTFFLDISGCTPICKSSGAWIPAYRVSGIHTINGISGGHLCLGRQGVGRQFLRAVNGTSILDSGGGRQRERALENNSVLGVRGAQRYVCSGGPQSIGRQGSEHPCINVREVDTGV
jgi:hypothetical protein